MASTSLLNNNSLAVKGSRSPVVQEGAEQPVCTIIDCLKRDLKRKPAEEVFTFVLEDGRTDEVFSYRDLAALITQFASTLESLKVQSSVGCQDKAIILLPPGKNFVAAFYACLATGVIAVPSFPPQNSLHFERLNIALGDLHNPIIICDKRIYEQVSSGVDASQYRLAIVEESVEQRVDNFERFQTNASDIAMLQYSSGSTGRPKGVMITNRNLIENSKLIKESFGHVAGKSKAAIWLPPYHDMGMVGGVLQGVYASYPTMLIPTTAFMRKQQRWLECISRYQATSSGGPNFAYELCVSNVSTKQLDHIDLSSWKVAFCGAEPIRHETMSNFANKYKPFGFNPDALYPCYGMAEATLMVSGKNHLEPMRTLKVDAALLAKNVVKRLDNQAQKNTKNLVSCGRVHDSMRAKIVDPMLQIEKSDGEIGEVWLSGSSIAKGYWRDDEKTQAIFNRKILNDDGFYHRTGDLGFLADGELYITGRIKEVIIINGENIYPQDIEFEAKAALPQLKNCRSAAFSLTCGSSETLALALEVPKTIEDFEGVKRQINARLVDKFGVKVSTLIFLPRKTIRVTSSGKIQRSLVKSLYQDNQLDVYRTLDASEQKPTQDSHIDKLLIVGSELPLAKAKLTDWLVALVANKVNSSLDKISPDDEFSSLGLDSVTAIDVLFEVEQRLGVVIPPEMLYELSSPSLLAGEILSQLKEEDVCNVE